MNKLYLAFTSLVLLLFSGSSYAQVFYNFSAEQGTFVDVGSRGTVATLSQLYAPSEGIPASDEGYNNNIPIGFGFLYNSGTTAYTSLKVCSNGFVALGTDFAENPNNGYFVNDLMFGPGSVSSAGYSPNNTSKRPIIAPFWGDLDISGSVRYQTTGVQPNRVFTIQWDKALFDWHATSPALSFQLRLYETTNVIEFVYRRDGGAVSDQGVASIGLTATGTGSGNFISLQDVSASPAISRTVEEDEIFELPATGQVYRFTPTSCIEPLNLRTGSGAGGTVSFTWSPLAGAAGYQYATSTSTTPPASGTATTDTTVNISGLNLSVINNLFVRTNCGGSFSSWARIALIPCTNNISPANGAQNVSVPPVIRWNKVAGATAYVIMYSTNGTTYNALGAVDSSATSVTVTGSAYGATYYWYIRPAFGNEVASTTCQANATSFTTMAKPAAPANDNCAGAIPIGFTSVTGTTFGATQTMAADSCSGDAGDANDDVWYKFTPINNGTARITLSNTPGYFDGVMQVYSGTCGSLTFIGCADSTFSGNETITLPNMVAGQTYYLRVFGFDAEGSEANFTITGAGSALPITLSSFRGERVGSKSLLTWTTSTEQNSKGFELQRSIDGKTFSSVAFVNSKAANGNSSSTLQYTYEDFKPFTGSNYYRLKQVDKDGKATLSGVVLLKGPKVSTLQLSAVYPNPATTVLKLIASAPANQKISLVVTDLAGKVVLRQSAEVSLGDNNLQVDITKLPAGSYMVKAICNDGCETAVSKFVKQ